MIKELSINGFIIRIDNGSLHKIKKPHSIYDGKTMVVIPFSAYNTHSTTKKFPKEYYDCIKKGSAAKTTIKADHVFFDSLLNLPVKPKKGSNGLYQNSI